MSRPSRSVLLQICWTIARHQHEAHGSRSIAKGWTLLKQLWGQLETFVVSYSARVSACWKGEQWQRILSLLCAPREWEATLEANVISGAGTSACGKGAQRQLALGLLSEPWEGKL